MPQLSHRRATVCNLSHRALAKTADSAYKRVVKIKIRTMTVKLEFKIRASSSCSSNSSTNFKAKVTKWSTQLCLWVSTCRICPISNSNIQASNWVECRLATEKALEHSRIKLNLWVKQHNFQLTRQCPQTIYIAHLLAIRHLPANFSSKWLSRLNNLGQERMVKLEE